ncbi:sigma-54 interaction domain-containing protein [Halalkalibacter alkaliphilus]|uniref:Sigma 54-interacting transcriptional regulator n=1 Tax=Halalkalibacter alkaliphilus TaxID=2917993 RepID=A0A9X2IAR0_9BACI|nr:sigma 54-interacting transcriptional regulator [Halalkalibacter alkaliphilus]MCL7749620.1 sigma 54-interacting transcriptional regulator [Halalkalibacter alkaliphilus]
MCDFALDYDSILLQRWISEKIITITEGEESLSMEKELSKSKVDNLKDFINNTEYPVFLFDANFKMVYFNKNAEPFIEFYKEPISMTMEKGKKQIEKTMLINSTTYKCKGFQINLNEEKFYYETIDPLTDEHEKIMNLHEELEMIINGVHDGIYVVDGRGFTLRINKSYSELTGITKSEVVGVHVSELVESGYFDISSTLKVLKYKKTVSILQRIKNTKQTWLVTAKPILNEEGAIKRIVSTIYDMTELNGLREELKGKSLAIRDKQKEIDVLRSQLSNVPGIIGNSNKMKKVVNLIQKLSSVNTSVLLLGETGVGKSMIAKALHNSGNRKEQNFIEINCGAIPENLFESELFGYKAGSFTGANSGGKKGLIEVANKGTLFLDEIGEMPMSLQVKLLTVLQNKQIRKVGDVIDKEVDVRIIAATNKDPHKLIDEGKLREDLYYRLSVVPIQIPSLKERKEDVFPLVNHFIDRYSKAHNKYIKLSREVMDVFYSYHWPGNIRELEHVIEQIIVLSDDNGLIDTTDLPQQILQRGKNLEQDFTSARSLKEITEDIEKKAIIEAWKSTLNIEKTAELLEVHRTTLIRKASKYRINFDRNPSDILNQQ